MMPKPNQSNEKMKAVAIPQDPLSVFLIIVRCIFCLLFLSCVLLHAWVFGLLGVSGD